MCPPVHELERLLRTARPQPRPDFVRSLEASLPRPRAPLRAPRWHVVFAACASGVAIIAITIVLGVAGALPFSTGAGKDAEAGPRCRTVFVERRTHLPHLVRGHDGDLRIVYRWRRVQEPVRRCR